MGSPAVPQRRRPEGYGDNQHEAISTPSNHGDRRRFADAKSTNGSSAARENDIACGGDDDDSASRAKVLDQKLTMVKMTTRGGPPFESLFPPGGLEERNRHGGRRDNSPSPQETPNDCVDHAERSYRSKD